jgi:hypothetical protein
MLGESINLNPGSFEGAFLKHLQGPATFEEGGAGLTV